MTINLFPFFVRMLQRQESRLCHLPSGCSTVRHQVLPLIYSPSFIDLLENNESVASERFQDFPFFLFYSLQK